ncbi:ATP-dependent Clp protease ATP-binding subunit ClpA [Nocardia sp. GAS34]|uniref:Clp protease N-terminal domain-containing protein n=1 Tax=unclassified Nocardia TaxID=2637762 RepID=UPI003D1ACBBC
MFERFSDSARRVVVLAQEQARSRHHDVIGAEHLLLGVIESAREDRAPGTRAALERLGLTPQAALATISLDPGPANHIPDAHLPFTAEAKTVLENSLRETIAVGEGVITPDHLLLGLIRTVGNTGDSTAAQAISSLRLTAEPLRQSLGGPHFSLSRLATKTLARASMEAQRFGNPDVDTPHLMLALLATDPDLCKRVFDAAGADPERIRAELDAVLGADE